jgi:tetratricopeptide (TPR) repeat protein
LVQAEELNDLASARFIEGRDAMRRGDYSAACAKFEESQQLDPSLGTLLNLGVCEEHQGHLLRASTLLERFLDAAEPSDDRRASAEQLAKSLDTRLSRLIVQVEPSGLLDIHLSVDGQPQRFGPGSPFVLDPGKHEVEITALGYSTARVTVELAEAEFAERRVVLEPPVTAAVGPRSVAAAPQAAAPQAAAPQAAVPEAKQALSPLFYLALGCGLSGALTIAGSGAMIANERATVQDHCAAKGCDATGLAAGQRGKTLVVVNTVAWPIAVIGASFAAYFVLFRDRQSKQQYSVGLAASPAQPSLFFEGRL